MTQKEIAMLLVRDGLATQKAGAAEYTEANRNPSLRALGNASIANCLEMLGGRGIVADVQPTISEHGMGFVYLIDPKLVDELSTEDGIARLVGSVFGGPPSETGATLAALLENCEEATINHIYRDDLLTSMKEMRICFGQECYIACLALAGKILEICLNKF